MSAAQWKDWFEIASNMTTIGALAVGGFWTYLLFVRNREKYPRAGLSQSVNCFRIGTELRIVHVAVRIENTGKVLLPIRNMECRLLQVLPMVGTLATRLNEPTTLIDQGRQCIAWPMLGKHLWTPPQGHAELEPGESETLRCDFALDDNGIEVIQIYSHLRNTAKNLVGWSCLSHIELNREELSMHGQPQRREERQMPMEPEPERVQPERPGPRPQRPPDEEPERVPPRRPTR